MHYLHMIWQNSEKIHSWIEALSALGALYVYFRNSDRERAKWLSSLYSKFYEAPDLKWVRDVLDSSPSDSSPVRDMVDKEDADFTDYLNFFEFMAYLKKYGQLTKRNIEAMFDYYLRILNKHATVRKYVESEKNGYGNLKELLPLFPYRSGS